MAYQTRPKLITGFLTMSNLNYSMGSHHLPVEEGRQFNLPRASRVCNLCNTDALGDERHVLLECPALADLRLHFSSPCCRVPVA